MIHSRRSFVSVAACLALVPWASSQALAQASDASTKPMTLVVPFTAGPARTLSHASSVTISPSCSIGPSSSTTGRVPAALWAPPWWPPLRPTARRC
jgi:tripartite-type tricarboxylate transporter receptor subunit TctC